MAKPIKYTTHVHDAVKERLIPDAWISRCVLQPDWVSADPFGDGRERRYKEISEYGARILRVVCIETDTEIRVITVFFDRRAKQP